MECEIEFNWDSVGCTCSPQNVSTTQCENYPVKRKSSNCHTKWQMVFPKSKYYREFIYWICLA